MDNQEAGNDMARQSKKKPTALFLSTLTLTLISIGFTAPAQAQSDDWFVMLRGDIGGFGAGSNFSWTAAGGVGYNVSDLFSIVAQYKALGVDFENDEAGTPDFLLFDAIVHGPLVGFVFRF